MFYHVLAGAINTFGWGLKPLLEKKGVTFSDPFTFANIRYTITAIICIGLLTIYKGTNIFKSLKYDTIKYSIIVGFVGLSAAFSNYYLLSKYDANYVIGIVEPGVIVVTLLLGHFFFNEKINSKRVLGIFIVCIGIYVIFTSREF